MKQANAKLLSEALLTSKELIRVSILWKEKWCKGLEEASHLYHSEKRVNSMLFLFIDIQLHLVNSNSTRNVRSLTTFA